MQKTILVIDDEPDILTLVQTRLKASGYEILTAADGEEGLAILKAQKPALVIADISMPKVDGYTFVLEAKKDEQLRDIPIIILTGKDMMEDIFKMEGVKDYIVKPFDVDVMLEKIKKYI